MSELVHCILTLVHLCSVKSDLLSQCFLYNHVKLQQIDPWFAFHLTYSCTVPELCAYCHYPECRTVLVILDIHWMYNCNSYQAGFTPTILSTLRAIRLCKPHSSIAVAITRPLRKRKLVSRKYWGQTFLEDKIPMVGNRQIGSRAVTASGRASVHQKTAIKSTTYRHLPSCREERRGIGN